MDQQKVFTENERILQQLGWEIKECGNGHTWYMSLQTNQCSGQIPLRVLMSQGLLRDDLKDWLDQHVAETPPSGNAVHTRLSTPPPRIGPSSSHTSLSVTSTATDSTPPLSIGPMIPNINDCSSDSTDDSETSSCQELVCDFRDDQSFTYEFKNEFTLEFTYEFDYLHHFMIHCFLRTAKATISSIQSLRGGSNLVMSM